MTRLVGWRLLAAAAGLAGAGLPLLVARRGVARMERSVSERVATAVAGYLAVVALPAVPERAPYDPRALLVAARGLLTLPGWSVPIEVFAVRTPLVSAGAPALPRDVWRELGHRDAPVVWRGGALVPLKDHDQRDLVGGVWVSGRAAPRHRRLAATGVAVLLVAAAGLWTVSAGRRGRLLTLAAGIAAVTGHGVTAGAEVRRVAMWGTERSLADARLLLEEVPTRLPGPRSRVSLAALRRVVQGTGLELAAADSADTAIVRVEGPAGPRAVAPVRITSRRWAALAMVPLESVAGRWTRLAIGLGLLGPGLWGVAQWGAAAGRRPQRVRDTATAGPG